MNREIVAQTSRKIVYSSPVEVEVEAGTVRRWSEALALRSAKRQGIHEGGIILQWLKSERIGGLEGFDVPWGELGEGA